MALRATLYQDEVGDPCEVVAFTLRDGLSQLFDLDLSFVCADPELDLDALIWSEALVEVVEAEAPEARAAERYHGVIEEAEYVDTRGELHLYRLRLRPRLHGLAYRVRTRIFQDQGVVDVARRVLREAGVPEASVVWSVSPPPPREYITQWKESELDFLLRLFEDEGIFFWHEHGPEGHTLHLADSPAVHAPIEGDPAIPCAEHDAHEGHAERVTDLARHARTTHEATRARDWNYLFAAGAVEGTQALAEGARRERYEFPGGFLTQAAGARKARDRMIAEVVPRDELEGESNSPRITPGRHFELINVFPADLAGDHLVWEVTRRYHNRGFTRDDAPVYTVRFRAQPAPWEFRPARVTPRPKVHGKESAVVTTPAGEEIHTDALGRIKVHFYWDREGAVDDTSSCWVRVQQQNVATSMVIPRAGWEVDVGFLFGDPDRPVVLQKLYNQETMPPYGLPGALAQSAWQSSSSPGGGGTNEIRMDDANGAMEFFVHAQRDLKVMVGHDHKEDVGVNASAQVATTNTESVGGSETVRVSGNQSSSVTGSVALETVGAKSVTVGATEEVGVSAMYGLKTAGARAETIGGVMNVLAQKVSESFNGSHSANIGGAQAINSGKAIAFNVAGGHTELVGAAKVEVARGSKQENIAGAKSLTAGLVRWKTGGDMTVAAEGAMALTVGGPLQVKAGGAVTLSGSSVTFNVGASAKLLAGGKIQATPGSVKLQGGSIGADGAQVIISGTVKYK